MPDDGEDQGDVQYRQHQCEFRGEDGIPLPHGHTVEAGPGIGGKVLAEEVEESKEDGAPYDGADGSGQVSCLAAAVVRRKAGLFFRRRFGDGGCIRFGGWCLRCTIQLYQ